MLILVSYPTYFSLNRYRPIIYWENVMPDTLRQAGVKPYFKPKAVNMLITSGMDIYI